MSNWNEGEKLDRCHYIIYNLKAEKHDLESRLRNQTDIIARHHRIIGEQDTRIKKLERERGRAYIEGVTIQPPTNLASFLTLQQWYAGASIEYVGNMLLEDAKHNDEVYTRKDVAEMSFDVADEMIKEGKKREGK